MAAPKRFCSSCGEELHWAAQFCPECGKDVQGDKPQKVAKSKPAKPAKVLPQFRKPKKKSTAVLIAIFTGHFTFLYTIQRDKAKFWILSSLYFLALFNPYTWALGGLMIWQISLWTAVARKRSWYSSPAETKPTNPSIDA